MPKRRTLLLSNAAFRVERVESLASSELSELSELSAASELSELSGLSKLVETDAQWSPVYQAASCRWVLPQQGVTEFRWGEHLGLLDGISVLWLPKDVPYQMQQMQQMRPVHPIAQQAVDIDSKIVVSLPADFAATVAAPRMGWLSARAQ